MAVLLAVLAWAWFVAGTVPFTASSTAVVLGTGLVAMVVGTRWWHRRRPRPAVTGRTLLPWVLVAGALTTWQLVAFTQEPRPDHPTLSSLTNAVLDGRPARALALAGWTVAAAWLARR